MIRAVIFDLDGVLVQTDELHYRSWQQLADEEGFHFDRQINERLRGVSRMESLDLVLAAAGRSCSPEEKRRLAERKNNAFLASVAQLTPADLLPGAMELARELRRRGIKTAVGSSSKNTRPILARVGLDGLFDAVVDANDVPRSKPDPAVFLRVAHDLGVPPGECLVIEDGRAGIDSARRAGMLVIGVGSAESLPGVTHRVASLAHVSVDDLLRVAGAP